MMGNDTTRPRVTRSQRRVLVVLERGGWACGADFLDGGAGWAWCSRISDLRALGFEIEKRRCRRHGHHAVVSEYRLSVEDERGAANCI
jgi:hypothetical protein